MHADPPVGHPGAREVALAFNLLLARVLRSARSANARARRELDAEIAEGEELAAGRELVEQDVE